MLSLEKVIDLLRPFAFIKEIEEICIALKNVHHEDAATEVRNQLQAIKHKSFYHQLNKAQLDNAIFEALIYLAKAYPLNHEDPISLEEFSTDVQNSVYVTSGHRFQIEPMTQYARNQNFLDIKNPFTNQKMDYLDQVHLINSLDKKNPNFIQSWPESMARDVFVWCFEVQRALEDFKSRSIEEQAKLLEMVFLLKWAFTYLINIGLAQFILQNYAIIFKRIEVPPISAVEEKILMASNFQSLLLNYLILETIFKKELIRIPKMRIALVSNLLGCVYLIVLDALMNGMSYIVKAFSDLKEMHQIEQMHAALMCNAFYFLLMTIQYSQKPRNLKFILELLFAQLSLMSISSFFKTVLFELYLGDNPATPEADLNKANHLYYFPISMLIMMYLLGIKNLIVKCAGYFFLENHRELNEEETLAIFLEQYRL